MGRSKKYVYDEIIYTKLGEAASFFVESSFVNLEMALQSDFASVLFGTFLKKIDPTPEDFEISSKVELPSNPAELLQTEIGEVLSDETINKMSYSWDLANLSSKKYKYDIKHNIKGISLIGHFNNLGFFFETLINRHLLFLYHSDLIDKEKFDRISKDKIAVKLNLIFEETHSLTKIKKLFSYRNKTVHYTPKNARDLRINFTELIEIWDEMISTIEILENKEKFRLEKYSDILSEYKNSIQDNWIK